MATRTTQGTTVVLHDREGKEKKSYHPYSSVNGRMPGEIEFGIIDLEPQRMVQIAGLPHQMASIGTSLFRYINGADSLARQFAGMVGGSGDEFATMPRLAPEVLDQLNAYVAELTTWHRQNNQ